MTTDLPIDADEVRSLATTVFRDGLIDATIRGHRPAATTSLERVRMRPVSIGDADVIQFEEFDGTNTNVMNLDIEVAIERIVHLFGSGMKTAFIRTTAGDLQVTISRRGKVQQVRHAPSRELSTTEHDRQKQHLIAESAPFLHHVGISTENGTVRPNARDKFRQVQQFVGILDRLVADHDRATSLRIVDLGCGSGVLTLAAHHHLMASGVNVHTIGVDLKEELMARLNNTVEQLGWSTIEFVTGAISQWQPKPGAEPDLVIALHACDTATDDAIAQAIAWKSPHLLVAPCCQHDLQRQIDRSRIPPGFESLVRHGIVRERLGDLLTDTFRADVLAALGWRTDVIEFVDNQHTAKNVMIRASQTGELDATAQTRALQLAAEWSVQPALIHLLADRSTT
ncbi:MAG: SAM-dependent methyltransferase [Ilumatobacteraceae bacterium]|nr:SAM-dependent methyltransferase [Ilumatobacteraceae bacterium]